MIIKGFISWDGLKQILKDVEHHVASSASQGKRPRTSEGGGEPGDATDPSSSKVAAPPVKHTPDFFMDNLEEL